MTDMNLAWLRLSSCEEGTPERTLSELLRRRGVSTLLKQLGIERVELALWVREKRVPDERHEDVCEIYRSMDADRRSSGAEPRLDVEVAAGMVARGEKLDFVGAEFGVSKQAVSKAMKRRAMAGAEGAEKKVAGSG